MDKYFQVEVISQTPNPQQTIYAAMHQDYAEDFVWAKRDRWPDEAKCGEIIVKRLLAGNRGHYGCLEHSQITINAGWFPHSTMQQIRTHRIGITMDVQSGRYTSQRIIDVANSDRTVEEVFYLRPAGFYSDRDGKKYEYTEEDIAEDLERIWDAAKHYRNRVEIRGFSEEHSRGLIPFDIRQHWVLSANVRSLMHLLDLRAKADAQLECQQLCELIWPHFEAWVPAIAAWYKDNRWKKARLAP